MKALARFHASSSLPVVSFMLLLLGPPSLFAQDTVLASQNAALEKLRARMDGISPVRFPGGAWQGESDQSAVAISPDGKQLAVSGTDAVIRNIADWQKVAAIPAANWLQWPAGGKFLFLSGTGTSIVFKRHELDAVTEDKIYSSSGKWMNPEFISRDGSILSVEESISFGDAKLAIWSTATGKILRTIHTIDIDTLYSGVHALSDDGKTIAFSTQEISDRTPGSYFITDSRQVIIGPADREGADVRVPTDFPPRALAFLPGNRGLVYVGEVSGVRYSPGASKQILLKLLDPRAPEKQPQAAVATIAADDSAFETVTVSPSGKYAAIADHASRVWVYELPSLKKLWSTGYGEIQETENIVFSPDEKMLTITGYGPAPHIIGLPNFQEIIPYPGHTSPVISLVFSPEGKTLTSFSRYNICHWNAATMKMLSRIVVPAGFAIISVEPHGHYALCIDQTANTPSWDAIPRTVKVLDPVSGRAISKMKVSVENLSRVSWLPEGQIVITFQDTPANIITKADYLKGRVLSCTPIGRVGQVDTYASADGLSFLLDMSQGSPGTRPTHLYTCDDLVTGSDDTVSVSIKGDGTLVWNGKQYHLLDPQPLKDLSPDRPVLPPLRGVAKYTAAAFDSANTRLAVAWEDGSIEIWPLPK